MNVTYLIGNGFDIACGLKTRYSDFIEMYVATPSSDKCIENFKRIIERDPCTWADAEFEFGKLTQKITRPEEFKTCFNDFLDNMGTYFTNQEASVKYDKLKKSDTRNMLKGLTDYLSFLPDESKEIIKECHETLDCNYCKMNFLVYNYTGVFERNLKRCRIMEQKTIEYPNADKQLCTFVSEPVQYAHGSLSKTPLIFGVNDINQIDYLVYRNSQAIKQTLLKPVENEKTHRLAFERCKNIIRQSDVIIIYGMSLGLTDSIWWQLILEHLSNNSKANLIIHYYYDLMCIRRGAGAFIDARDECVNRFITNAQSAIHPQTTLTNRIHVVFNQNPFHIVMHAQ